MPRPLPLATLVALAVATGAANIAVGQSPERNTTKKGFVRFANNTTITVYIPADPDKVQGRRQALIDGMKLWFDDPTLKDRGIKIQVTDTKPAGNVSNVVDVTWDPPGSLGNDERGEGGPKWDDSHLDASGNAVAEGGDIHIDRGVSSNDEAFNLGAHEMGHVLGLGHDPNGSPVDVMYPVIRTDGRLTLSSRNAGKAGDVAELKETYAANHDDTTIQFVATASPADMAFRYIYTATWTSGGPLAVFQVDTRGATIFDIAPPPGWMVDAFDVPNDWLDLRTGFANELFLGFVHQSDEFDLAADNPVLTFAFSSTARPGAGEAFFNGTFETLTPVLTPEPSTLTLVGAGLAGLAAIASSSRRLKPRSRRGSRATGRERRSFIRLCGVAFAKSKPPRAGQCRRVRRLSAPVS